MSRLTRCLLCLLALSVSVLARGAADWSKVKTGITPAEAADALGTPLIRTYGRGFQMWIYDGCGEIIFAGGPAMGWTRPAPTQESLSRPVESDVLIRPVIRLPSLRGFTPQRQNVQTYEDPFDTRFRSKQ
jgi:hypothetical protein